MIKNILKFCLGLGLIVGLHFSLDANAAVTQGFQGGTGYATTTAGNVGKCLEVSSSSPFLTYTFGTCAGSSSGGVATSSPTTGFAVFVNGSTITGTSSLVTSFNGATGTISYSSPATTTINGAQCPSFIFSVVSTSTISSVSTSTCNIFLNLLAYSSSTNIDVSATSGIIRFTSPFVSTFNGQSGAVNGVSSLNLIYGDLSLAVRASGTTPSIEGGGAPFYINIPSPTSSNFYAPSTTIPTVVSQLTNDAGYTTSSTAVSVGFASNYFLDNTASFADNFTLTPVPSVLSESIISVNASSGNSPVLLERFVSNQLGVSSIPAGDWQFDTWGTTSNTAGQNSINVRINRRVQQLNASGTFSGSGPTRTFTLDSQPGLFVAGDADPDRMMASLIETPTQTAWISGFTNSSTITVTLTDPTFVNVSATLSAIYYHLFHAIGNQLTTSVADGATTATEPAFAVSSTDRLVAAYFASTTQSLPRTISLYIGGTAHYSMFHAPILIPHNNLSGLQGGAANDYYHITQSSSTNFDTAYNNRITSALTPLSISNNIIQVATATTAQNGILTSTDWNTFNGKISTSTYNVNAQACGGTDKISAISATGTALCTTDQTGGGGSGSASSTIQSFIFGENVNAGSALYISTGVLGEATASSTTFSYTGGVQTFTIPARVSSITIFAKGGKGASSTTAGGGFGGSASGTLSVTPGDTYSIIVGGAATSSAGAFGGGGSSNGANPGGGGGGMTWIDKTNSTFTSSTVILVAAGGGGGGGTGNATNGGAGGGGGGLTGTNGTAGGCGTGNGTGGSQSAGGNGGAGCDGGGAGGNGVSGAGGSQLSADTGGGGAGGGGYYGGGAGGGSSGNPSKSGSGGAGGSSFASSTLTSTSTAANINAGNGSMVITYNIIGVASCAAGTVCASSAADTSYSNSYIGVSQATTTSGNAGNVIIGGVAPVNTSSTLLPGTQYYLGNSSGTFSSVVGIVTRKAGIGINTSTILITNIW